MDLSFEHVRACNERLREAHDLTDLDAPLNDFLVLRLQHAAHRVLHIVQRIVDDAVGADVHILRVSETPRICIRADVERNDDCLRCRREHDIRLTDRTDA